MFFIRTEGRTRLSGPPAIEAATTRVAGGNQPPAAIFEQTTATYTALPTGTCNVTFDAGAGNVFNIDGAALVTDGTGSTSIELIAGDSSTLPTAGNSHLTQATGVTASIAFTPKIASRYVRVRMACDLASPIAMLWLGQWQHLPQGIGSPFIMPNQSETFTTTETSTASIRALGARAQPMPTKTMLRLQNFSPAFFNAFEPTRQHYAKGNPGFLVPDINAPTEFGIIQAAADVPAPQRKTPRVADWQMPIKYLAQ